MKRCQMLPKCKRVLHTSWLLLVVGGEGTVSTVGIAGALGTVGTPGTVGWLPAPHELGLATAEILGSQLPLPASRGWPSRHLRLAQLRLSVLLTGLGFLDEEDFRSTAGSPCQRLKTRVRGLLCAGVGHLVPKALACSMPP